MNISTEFAKDMVWTAIRGAYDIGSDAAAVPFQVWERLTEADKEHMAASAKAYRVRITFGNTLP